MIGGKAAGANPCLSAKQKKHLLRVLFCLVIIDVGIRKAEKQSNPVDALPASGSAADQTAQHEVQAVCR